MRDDAIKAALAEAPKDKRLISAQWDHWDRVSRLTLLFERGPRHWTVWLAVYSVEDRGPNLPPRRKLLARKQLKRNEVIEMADQQLTVGHTADLAIEYFDQNGNPMLTPVIPDSPPAWTQSAPAVCTLTPSSDDMTATELAIAPGEDIVSLAVVVGGATFNATQGFQVSAAAQVLTSIGIGVTTVQPTPAAAAAAKKA